MFIDLTTLNREEIEQTEEEIAEGKEVEFKETKWRFAVQIDKIIGIADLPTGGTRISTVDSDYIDVIEEYDYVREQTKRHGKV